MEKDLIISEIDTIHKNIDNALEQKNSDAYLNQFDEEIAYKKADGTILNKVELSDEIKKYFKKIKSLSTSHYRIKSSLHDDTFTEKIARKSVAQQSNLLFFSKRKTTQTEEIYQWKKFGNEWKAISVEIVLEENY